MLPVIDLCAGSPAMQAVAIDTALREHGFYALLNHGVPPEVTARAFEAGHRFFALAEAAKQVWHVDHLALANGLKRGFDPIGWRALDPAMPPDLKESFYAGAESAGPNQWPGDAWVPGFRAACMAYTSAMLALSRRLMGLYETALGLPVGYFDAFMRDPIHTTRLLHYPPQPAQAAPGQIGCGAHTDWGAITLLAQDDAGGLQVQRADGTWFEVAPMPGALVVNAGDMLPRWTNDRWRSAPHRVVNHLSGRDRWSVAFFFDLDADASIAPLDVCLSAAQPARYAPITAGEHLAAMYRRTTVAV